MTARRPIASGHGRTLWPVLFLLVLVPTACVLWMTGVAVRNARLATRQRLEEAYQGPLRLARDRLSDEFDKRREHLASFGPLASSRECFVRCVRSNAADSVVCYDAFGHVIYPGELTKAIHDASQDGRWSAAQYVEFVEADPARAAELYAALAAAVPDANDAASALLAQARCLARAGQKDEAIEILAKKLAEEEFGRAVDPQGRLIAADALARAVELSPDRSSPRCLAAARRLARLLADYNTTDMPAAQRRFLMNKLTALAPEVAQFPTLPAENLAAAYVALDAEPAPAGRLAPAGVADTWQLVSPDRRLVALLRTDTLRAALADALGPGASTDGVTFDLLPPEATPPAGVLSSIAVGPDLPGWQVTVSLDGDAGCDSTADAQATVYLWIAVLVIAATTVLALLIGRSLQYQMRLARLKNDLVATVSHELKTPLASMRLLVDTLLDAEKPDDAKTREYLQLVSKENLRLSRLIDNFLTFSRMERGRHAFESRPTEVASIVDEVRQSIGERFDVPGCRFAIEVADDVPPVSADFDAIVTAVLNLLDNAYKYTPEEKQITLRVSADGDAISFAVTDNGIGLTRADARRVFRRFYQVDRRLTRTVGGCGLGLAIVKFIADEHGGSIDVESRPGHGSTFTLRIPTP